MRILLLQQGDPEKAAAAGSGTPYYLARALERHGAQVIVRNCEPQGFGRYVLAGVTLSPSRRRWVAKFNIGPMALRVRTSLAERHVLREMGNADVVVQYGSGFSPGLGMPYFCYADNFIANSHAEELSWARQLSPADYAFSVEHEQRLFRNATGIFSFSKLIGDALTRLHGISAASIRVAHPGPNFLSPPRYDVSQRAPNPTILFIGRAWKEKGGPELVAAFELVRRRVPNARLVIVGPTELSVQQDGIDFVGYLSKDDPTQADQLQQILREAWVFCLPTRYESFGMVYVEAMWNGVPAIGTDDWAIPEIIDEGKTGYRVPMDDVNCLADRLCALLEDEALRTRMSISARTSAEHKFAWDKTAESMLSFITERVGA